MKISGIDRHWREIECVRGSQGKVDLLKREATRHMISAVDMPEIAIADIVLVKHVNDLTADKTVPYGRKMQEDQNRQVGILTAQSDGRTVLNGRAKRRLNA